jgi:hypothetical protein
MSRGSGVVITLFSVVDVDAEADLLGGEEVGAAAQAAAAGVAEAPPVAWISTVRLPNNILAMHHQLVFAATDGAFVESMCWWLCLCQDPERNKPALHTIVVTQHTATETSVEPTPHGRAQLTNFLIQNPSLRVFAWCHSHHSKLLGIASRVDLGQQFQLHRAESPNEICMAIVWRRGIESHGGFSLQRLRADRVGELTARQGQIDSHVHEVSEFLEEVPTTLDGPSVRLVRLGGLVASPPSAAASAGPRPLVASLLDTTAADVLEHLRRVRDATGRSVLPASEWIESIVLPGPACSAERAHARIATALNTLRATGNITLSWAPGAVAVSRVARCTVTLREATPLVRVPVAGASPVRAARPS